jgi:hypothetical protein
VRTYEDSNVGTVDYTTGMVSANPIYITSVSNIDGNTSTALRMTATPSSTDIVGRRNQILEIDTLNTTINGGQDTIAVSGSGVSTYNTTTSYVAPSSY